MNGYLIRCTACLVCLALAGTALAQESRLINPIARPKAPIALPSGAMPVNPPQPVTREQVAAAVAKVTQAWSDRQLDQVLAPGFTDRQRLIDALETQVPRDARLRVMGIQGWQVLAQYRQDGNLVSKLSVTVSTQVEFNDPASGYQVVPGTQDYLITLSERAGS